MKVKIGNKIFDSEKIPIMVVLQDKEKELISNMGTQNRICFYPEDYNVDDIFNIIPTGPKTENLRLEISGVEMFTGCMCKSPEEKQLWINSKLEKYGFNLNKVVCYKKDLITGCYVYEQLKEVLE